MQKANNAKHSKTKLPWFRRLLPHLDRKRGELILQHSRAHPTIPTEYLTNSVLHETSHIAPSTMTDHIHSEFIGGYEFPFWNHVSCGISCITTELQESAPVYAGVYACILTE